MRHKNNTSFNQRRIAHRTVGVFALGASILWTAGVYAQPESIETSNTPAPSSDEQTTESKPKKLEEVVVQSTPIEKTLFENAQPITVLTGTELQNKAQSTLGDTLASEPGISATSFGPGASRPVIRGLGGDRIRILENGIGSQDVSNTSPDHATTVEPTLVDKIEVVRGPAALLYGTSAVGGIVNVFDNRIPEELPEAPISGSAEIRGGTVDNERSGVFSVNAPAGPFAIHVDGLLRKTDDIDIPGFARTKDERENGEVLPYPEPKGKLPFSDTDSDNITLGSSYISEQGFIGAAVSDYNSNYGVPNGEENISIDLERKRADIHGKLFDPISSIKSMDFKLGTTSYEHTEFEGEEVGTKFKNDGVDTRYEIAHTKIGPFAGVLGFQYQYSDFAAIGEEAFQPPTITNTGSTFLFEETSLSDSVTLQLGGRFDYQDLDTIGFETEDNEGRSGINKTFPTFSQSAGVVWTPYEDYAAALSLAHTERAPAGQELFADGPHVATAAFEIGDPELDKERSLGVDLSLRKKTGTVTGSIGGFFNYFNDYIGLSPTGEVEDDLDVFRFVAQDVNFFGIESQIAYHLIDREGEDLSIDYQPDWVWAEDRDTSDPLPRIPPLRMKGGINYSRENIFSTRLELQHVFKQSRNAPLESETDGYSFLNLYANKVVPIENYKLDFFLRGTNLLGEKARDHVSFIKDVAPLPGANVLAGVRVNF